jgi:hypothetical protein
MNEAPLSLVRILRAVIAAFYDLPPAAVAFSIIVLTFVCYFVLPPWSGLPLLLLLAPLPWYEEQLDALLARRREGAERTGRP